MGIQPISDSQRPNDDRSSASNNFFVKSLYLTPGQVYRFTRLQIS